MAWNKYVLAFLITAAIFVTAFYLTTRLDDKRLADIRTTQEAISIDILSTETQFELLGQLDCAAITENPVLSEELNNLASRLSVAEQNLGVDNPEVISIKKQYSLLEIKDYLLMKQISQKCPKSKPVSVLYFYSNLGDCPDCGRTGEVLTYLRQAYPGLRVYSFDYNLDLGALQTLIALNNIEGARLPAIVINDKKPVYGFRNLDDMEKIIPNLESLAATSTQATSTRGN
jgi:hypothetical protein